MSLYSSMNTALSGMNAQSRALGHISDNVANSQTQGPVISTAIAKAIWSMVPAMYCKVGR